MGEIKELYGVLENTFGKEAVRLRTKRKEKKLIICLEKPSNDSFEMVIDVLNFDMV